MSGPSVSIVLRCSSGHIEVPAGLVGVLAEVMVVPLEVAREVAAQQAQPAGDEWSDHFRQAFSAARDVIAEFLEDARGELAGVRIQIRGHAEALTLGKAELWAVRHALLAIRSDGVCHAAAALRRCTFAIAPADSVLPTLGFPSGDLADGGFASQAQQDLPTGGVEVAASKRGAEQV